MEQWQAIIENLERPPDQCHRTFEKTLETAAALLTTAATQLAPFETEWLVETLLHSPVELLTTVSQKRGDEVWRKAVADALKLMASVAGLSHKYYEQIVDICLLNYDPELRKHALACLAEVAKHSDAATRDFARHVQALEEATQCRAPIALLVGALCEHHPAVVCDELTRIWRGYLNMLGNNKNTDTVTKSALEGVCSLFKHFGDELPCAELNHFYDNLAKVYIDKSGCQTVCYSILAEHASLFRERVSADRALRSKLWGAAPPATLLGVYAVAQCETKTAFINILTSEVLPHTQSPSYQVKTTALRILGATKSFGDLSQFADIHTLEYELRGKVSHADAELILWCVEYGLPNSERLLQAAILFYDNLPQATRKKIVVKGISNSPPELKRATIQFLISQSCEDWEARVWRDLLEDDDVTIVTAVIRELADCLAAALQAIHEDEIEELPPKLSSLLRLASLVPPAHAVPLRACGPQLRGLIHHAATLNAAKILLAGASDLYKSIRLHRCRDEATLHAACLALVQSPEDVDIDAGEILTALHIIFSSDVEPKIHIEALRKFDYLLTKEKKSDIDIRDVIRSVEKLRSRGDRTDRDVRILHRKITMFLGKHGTVDMNNNRDTWDDAVVVDLKKSLALTLPHQGSSYKVDLKTILLLALQQEDPRTLLTLLAMLCVNLSSNKDANTQRAIIRVARSLANAHAAGGGDYTAHIQHAVRLCDTAGVDLLQYITSSKSCGARKLLAMALSALCEEPDVLRRVAERTSVMLASSQSTTKRAGLDIADTILTSLENNHALSKTMLPELITLIAKTYESDTKTIFTIASKAFVDKKQLFDKETVRKTIFNLLDNILKSNLSDVKIYKHTVKVTIEFVKNLRDVKLDELANVVFDISKYDVNVKTLYVLAVMKSEFDFDSDISRKILGREDCVLLNCLLRLTIDKNDVFKMEVILKFLEEYSEGILELKYMETIQLISDIITNFTPTLLKEFHKNIKLCFTSLKKHWKNTPKTIIASIQTWLNMLPIKKITESIEHELFTTEHHLYIQAINIMSNIFDMSELILPDVKEQMSKWPKYLTKLYASGRLEEYFYEEMSYFTDMLTVSLKFLTTEDVEKILKGEKPKNGISFGAFFIEGCFEVLTEKPFILLQDGIKECSVILNDIVRMTVKKCFKERFENVLELVNKLWPTYEIHATFVQKHCLLANLQCLGPGPDSNPLQWATRVVCSQDASLDQRTKLLCFLPEEAFKLPEVKASVSSLFPARLRELRPALLEAAAKRPDALLPTIAALAGNDTSTGWWDTALESCIASSAKRNNVDLCGTLFQKCQGERACERVLVPLLRHSSTDICERFLASVLDRIVGNLRKGPRGDPAHPSYRKRWENHLISLYLLLVAFEKLPTSSLESPASVLYSATTDATPWHLVRETCIWCHRLRDNLHCPLPDDQLFPMYRKLQCLIYNVMCAAICRRRPAAPPYEQLLSTDALQRIVDEKEEYVLPIRASWTQRTKLFPVAVPLEPSTLSPSHTQRSRIFLRTLSEDPMLFDLHSSVEEQMEVQDISLVETPLNSYPCAGTLTALLRHAAGVSTLASLWRILACLLKGGTSGKNLKWLIAQVICNCKEELKPQASVLLPGLLAVLASIDEGKCMNGLHLDVLDTILYWKEDITSGDLNIITHHLIRTCMENRRKNVFDGLLRTLQGFLELYGTIQVEWKSFETYYEDPHHDTQKALFKIIKMISKTKYIPTVLSKIVAKLDTDPSNVSECFGLAMACGIPSEKGPALGEFRRYLEKCNGITSYVRVLYYASLGCAECCGEQEFRKIADYVTKVISYDRTKCLYILSCYLSRGRRSEYIVDMFDTIDLPHMIDKDQKALLLVKHGLPLMDETMKRRCVAQIAALKPATAKVRKLVVDVMQKAYDELFTTPPQPPAKRQKTETTPILSVSRDDIYTNSILTCLGVYAEDANEEVAKVARDALEGNLDKDLGARFAECFLLAVYLPAHTDKPPDVCVCVSALLEMLFGGVRGAEGFKEIRLREEPLPVREEPGSRLLTLSRTFQGTFGSYSATRGRTRTRGNPSTVRSDANNSAIDVQISIDSILQTLLDFAKTSTDAARSLLIEVLRSVLSNTKFDVESTLVPLLGTLLGREPTDLTPLYIDICRVLEGKVGLLAPVERLRALTAGSEGAALTRLLYEEVAMRCSGDAIFQLGQPEDIQDVVMNETATFSIQDLKHAFGKLSNWDDLALQQRKSVRGTLPPLWTDRRDFITLLDSYQAPENAEIWFDKMAAAFKRQPVNSWRWLRKADQWPRRHFEISATTEALSWQHDPTETMPSQLFKTSDCLAECAARLMIRSSYYNSLQLSEKDDKTSKLSRSHELRWCMRANEMGIPNLALQCVERNVEELSGVETLAWLRQKLLALRQTALERENSELLRDVLKKAEKCTPQYSHDPSVCIEMYHLMLLLYNDLNSLQHHDLQTILVAVHRSSSQVDWSTRSKDAISSVFEIAVGHYDEALETGTTDTDNALANISEVVTRAAALNMPKTDLFLAVLLNRLNGFQGQLEWETTRDLLEKLAPILPTLDVFSLGLLEKNAHKFAAELQRTLAAMLPKDASVEKYRRCLQLVCDPNHLLTHYCEELVMALRNKDGSRWKSTLDRMTEKIFDNPYAGPSYKLLDKYKDDLYGMYEFEPTSEFASRAESKLRSIVSIRRDPQTTLRLSDLCPTLLGPIEHTGVEKWLGLRGVKVIKFYDKVQVFTDSIRRPVVISMLLSCGRTHRVIHKTGEPLTRDAASQRVASALYATAYTVTLLDEESALIEFLEGHERLRVMIANTCNLDVLHGVNRPADCLLVESPSASSQAHEQLCTKVPANALRSAMEQSSSCVQDFIWKKRKFTDSLADMTLLTWLLGLGDRHLQNIMCSRVGAVRAVDFGDVWRCSELPARLTRNLLAVTDTQVLEARLQSSLSAMRGSALLLEAAVRVAFHWMEPEIEDQMRHVRGILRGNMSSYDVCRDVTNRSQLKYKEKYIQLLERTLGDSHRDLYSVEEQISCLLRHCTCPELLSVVRAGWEPWV